MGEFLRKYATPLSVVAFLAAGVTGVLMFFGVRNHEFNELHEWFGVGFVVIAILHLMRNGKAFGFMLTQARSWVIIGVLGIAAAFMSASALTNTESGGGNPFRAQAAVAQRVANAPITQSAPILGLTAGQVITRLRAGGIQVDGPGQSLADIARKADKPTPQLYVLILGEGGGDRD